MGKSSYYPAPELFLGKQNIFFSHPHTKIYYIFFCESKQKNSFLTAPSFPPSFPLLSRLFCLRTTKVNNFTSSCYMTYFNNRSRSDCLLREGSCNDIYMQTRTRTYHAVSAWHNMIFKMTTVQVYFSYKKNFFRREVFCHLIADFLFDAQTRGRSDRPSLSSFTLTWALGGNE